MAVGHKAHILAEALGVNYKTFLSWVKEFEIPHTTKSGSKFFDDQGMDIAKFVKNLKDKRFGTEEIGSLLLDRFGDYTERLDQSQNILDGRNLKVDLQTVVTEAMKHSISESWGIVEMYGEAMKKIGELEAENKLLKHQLKQMPLPFKDL
jgi:DNA-binding transcriptional MerR regulator